MKINFAFTITTTTFFFIFYIKGTWFHFTVASVLRYSSGLAPVGEKDVSAEPVVTTWWEGPPHATPAHLRSVWSPACSSSTVHDTVL